MDKHIMIFDPVPCKGGSKKVAKALLPLCGKDTQITLVSNDQQSWRDLSITILPLPKSAWLMKQEHGIGYFFKHFVFCLCLGFYMLRFGRPTKLLGISGPTIDFALYIIGWLINRDIVQLIQGSVSSSSIAAFCLRKARVVFYLKSTENSITSALLQSKKHIVQLANKFVVFENAVDPKDISLRINMASVGILWAASTQPWKRIDKFVEAFAQLEQRQQRQMSAYRGNICYLGDLHDDVATRVDQINTLTMHQDPQNYDQLRSQSSIFVSTSENEPFGLAILEAMLAGLVIVIPSDNAYWDQQLVDGVDCIKYHPDQIDCLSQVLSELIIDQDLRNRLAKNSQAIAKNYTQPEHYKRIVNNLVN